MTTALALVLAEPEPETRGYLERHLSRDGFEVLGTERGGEALELAERVKPDLLLVNSSLPDGSGLDVCTRLREGEPGRSWNTNTPLILLGARDADAVDRVRAFSRGCDDFLARPFVYDELVGAISSYPQYPLSSKNGLVEPDLKPDPSQPTARSSLSENRDRPI